MIATLLYCYPLHDYYNTMLLCCYVGDCSTMQGLVMALFIDWPEKDWSFVFCNITSHHITSHYIEQNISLVKSRHWETGQDNHQIFNNSHKSKKKYVFVILHPIQATEPPDVMYGWCPKCRDKYSTEYAQLCGLVLYSYICLLGCARWLVNRDDDKRVL